MQGYIPGIIQDELTQERLYLIGLAQIAHLRGKTVEILLRHFKSFKSIWLAPEKELKRLPELPTNFADNFLKIRNEVEPGTLVDKLQSQGIRALTILDYDYPDNLKQIYDPPLVLYYQGIWEMEELHTMGIVGSRRTTVYGERMAEKFGRELAEAGFVIISGMARGVDSYAHRGCLEVGGKTIAVLGSGLDVIYPKENIKLAENIKRTGILLTEYPLGTPPLAINFPARNRIIAGLSLGVLVVEAAVKSGALITADFAMEVGREVFAIPGPITSPNSEGTNNLIKQGAKLVGQVGDILEEFGFAQKLTSAKIEKSLKDLTPDEKIIYDALSWNPLRVEELVKQTSWTPSKVQTILTLLELHGVVEQKVGRQFIRKDL